MKQTKTQIINRLRDLNTSKLEKTLKDIIAYTLMEFDKNPRNVDAYDLNSILEDLRTAKVTLPPVTTEVLAPVAEVKKPAEKKADVAPKPEAKKVVSPKPAEKPVEKVEEKPVVAKVEKPATKVTPQAVKKVEKPEAKPAEKVTAPKAEKPKPTAPEVKAPVKEAFPDEYEVQGKKLKKVGLLKDFMNSEETLYTLMDLAPEELHDNQTYNDMGFVTNKLKALPDNRDVITLIWTTERVVYAVSVYTEVFYTFQGKQKGLLPVYIQV